MEPENDNPPVVEPDAVPPVVEVPETVVEEHSTDNRPGFVDDILGAISGLADKIDGMTPTVTDPANPGSTDPELPGHNQVVTDESPARKPWTHRKLFGN